MVKVRKAVIPAAGYGTGFLPATKAQPKELLPIVDKPIIQFIIEEAIQSGIEEILIITGKHKRAIEDHFDSNIELEDNLEKKGKTELLEIVRSTTRTNLYFVRQSYPKGLGDAIYHAKAFVNDEPFVVMLGDNIMVGDQPATKQLIDLYEEIEAPLIAVLPTDKAEISNYGVIQLNQELADHPGVYEVSHFIEKPAAEQAPSNLAIAGRYILPATIFDVLEDLDPGVDDEIQLTDAIERLNQQTRVFAKEIDSQRYDVGNKFGYMQMSLAYGLQHPETASGLKTYLQDLAQKLR
ncbi:UTP--glucose-1-phosphate uridylyltransferase GalU [Ignavigranum ruoffiae]|uniref:UTP--glucose-1-phosphate uridylyltransferase n=2 Tax=Ignavigranum ruoffiae TaxID=89093 RepID=A0A1H9FD40_9LACT|nr:UTP--glucose-1-phosphate uridylyltransferase GalU [Ignavigranum ruoffiae]UPQ86585.1 UTP--glucose-1-phosphate uridylyltransferase GalU [Ignavigranum ruoffiae]SEQ35832.1 UDP-glucose pyrophosphorylase [Ignavigranum ruoffiae]